MYIFCSICLSFLIIFLTIAFNSVIDELLKIRATLEVIASILRKDNK